MTSCSATSGSPPTSNSPLRARPFFMPSSSASTASCSWFPRKQWGWVPAHMGTWVWLKRGWTWIPGDWFHSGIVDYSGVSRFPRWAITWRLSTWALCPGGSRYVPEPQEPDPEAHGPKRPCPAAPLIGDHQEDREDAPRANAWASSGPCRSSTGKNCRRPRRPRSRCPFPACRRGQPRPAPKCRRPPPASGPVRGGARLEPGQPLGGPQRTTASATPAPAIPWSAPN